MFFKKKKKYLVASGYENYRKFVDSDTDKKKVNNKLAFSL